MAIVPTSSEVLEGLRRIRVRRRFMWAMLLGYVPVVMVISWLGIAPFEEVAGTLWFAMVGATWMISMYSRCPRCNEFFHSRILWGNPWRTKCANCGLPLGRSKDLWAG